MNGVQCNELFGGIALKNHAFLFSLMSFRRCSKESFLQKKDVTNSFNNIEASNILMTFLANEAHKNVLEMANS